MRRIAQSLLAGATILLTPAVASAASPRSLGVSAEPVEADGSRFAAYRSGPAELTVIDDARGRTFTVAVEPRCQTGDMAPVGLMLLYCGRTETHDPELRVLDLRHGTTTLVPSGTGGSGGFDPSFESYDELGRRWLAGESSASGHRVRVYLDWHTGAKRSFGEDGAGGSYTPRDLDDEALPRIAPARPGGRDFDRDPPFSVTPTRTFDRDVWSDLTLFRGGTRRTFGTRVARLDHCPTWCGSIAIGAGLVTWSRGRVARAYVLGGGRRLQWRFDRVLTPTGNLGRAVRHTRTTVYVSVRDPATGTMRLFAANWR